MYPLTIGVNLRDRPRPRGFSKMILPVNQQDNQGNFTDKKSIKNPRGLKFSMISMIQQRFL